MTLRRFVQNLTDAMKINDVAVNFSFLLIGLAKPDITKVTRKLFLDSSRQSGGRW